MNETITEVGAMADNVDRMNRLYAVNGQIIKGHEGGGQIDTASVRKTIQGLIDEADEAADHEAGKYGRKLLNTVKG